jgi:hypothetical protein
MPTEIRERQLSFVAYVLWRIRMRLAEWCFAGSKALERIPLTFEHSPRGERSFCILVG